MSKAMPVETPPENIWYKVDVKEIPSPGLLIFPDRVESNILKMKAIADVNFLRPHVKTHKMAGIIKLQLKHGIRKFKCATIAEAEMAAEAGAADILLAVQPVGPNVERYIKLQLTFPDTIFACIVDSEEIINDLSAIARQKGIIVNIWIDINNGMNRTGVPPGKEALILFRSISACPELRAIGLHVYDGHIHEPLLPDRKKICDEAYAPVERLLNEILRTSGREIEVVAGGTPTFPVHATRKGVETSPGTTLLWDYGYSSTFTDLDFLHSAVLLTRVVSKPGGDLICLDLGHKAIASEMPQPRVKLLGLDKYEIVGHNEEHMVIKTIQAGSIKTGDVLFGIPWHICPTVDRYDFVTTVRDGIAMETWSVEARKRSITI